MNPTYVRNNSLGICVSCLLMIAGTNAVASNPIVAAPPVRFVNDQAYSAGIACNLPPIPLTLIYFNLDKTHTGKINLSWKTAQEMNVSHFNIEKSTDGRKWAKVGTVKATGREGSIETYSYVDAGPVGDANYYRLAVVDDDASVDYSPVRLLTSGQENVIRIYPTLTNSNSTLYVEGISPEDALVELFGASGRAFEKVRMYSNTITLPGVPPGIYQVRISNVTTKTTACLQKIVVY